MDTPKPVDKGLKDTEEESYRKKKFISLYTARSILAKYGTMPERRLVRKQLKLMEKKK